MTTKTTKTTIVALAAAGLLALGGGAVVNAATSGGTSTPAATQGQGHSRGQGQGQGQGHGKGHGQGQGMGHGNGQGEEGAGTSTAAPLTVTEEQQAELEYMREEEKLAGDVYATLAKSYPDAPFSRILQSERKHESAVQAQLDRAGIADPTAGNAVGEFENADLQRLYDGLVKQGSASMTAALQVGALIEETDIADLRQAAAGATDSQVKQVYANLERASNQHLRAYTSALRSVGVTYEPTVLSEASYAKILASSMQR